MGDPTRAKAEALADRLVCDVLGGLTPESVDAIEAALLEERIEGALAVRADSIYGRRIQAHALRHAARDFDHPDVAVCNKVIGWLERRAGEVER